jgi:hypothetical protein
MADNIKEQIENSIIDCINIGVSGRLVIFKPEDNIFGADLAVERRGKYKEKEIYFAINSLVGPSKDNNFTKDFLQENFKTDQNFYLVFAYFDEVRQKISDYIWLVPSLQFKDVAGVVKSKDNKNLLRFETSLDIKNKDKYSRFIVNTKDLGKLTLGALEKGGKFSFKSEEFEGKKEVSLESLKDFLCDARANTYASNASPIDNPRLLASKQLEFQKGDYFYRDVYFSGDKMFLGQEIIYLDLKPVWGMNYIGDQINKTEADFLKESLLKLSDKCRIGGICEYKKRDFWYQDKGQGNLEEFSGKETISSGNKVIYNLNYQGGLI